MAGPNTLAIVGNVQTIFLEQALPLIEKAATATAKTTAKTNASSASAADDDDDITEEEKYIDVFQLACSIVLDAFGRVGLGVQLSMTDGKNLEFYKAFRTMVDGVPSKLKQPFPWMWKIPTKSNRKMAAAVATLRHFVTNIIQEKKNQNNNNNNNNNNKDGKLSTQEETSTILDQLLASENLSEEEVVDNISGLFIASFESTASTISFVIHLLATHPQVQQCLYEEICSRKPTTTTSTQNDDDDDQRSSTSNNNNKNLFRFSVEDIQAMEYLDIVLKESMRFIPTSPNWSRTSLQDVMIPLPSRKTSQNNESSSSSSSSYLFIPKDTIILINIARMCRMGELWPNHPSDEDMKTFRPERWYEFGRTSSLPSRQVYSPFGAGARTCVGERLAILEIKVVIASLIARYEVFVDPKRPLCLGFSTFRCPLGGAWFSFRARSSSR